MRTMLNPSPNGNLNPSPNGSLNPSPNDRNGSLTKRLGPVGLLGLLLGLGNMLGCGPVAKGQTRGPMSPTQMAASSKGEALLDVKTVGLPFTILRRGGGEIDEPTFFAELYGQRAVCLGESHDNPHHHWAQYYVFDKLSQHNGETQVTTALGMEMFQRPFQAVLDDYVAGKIDDKALLTRSGYAERWGYNWGFYASTVGLVRDRKLTLLALNTAKELTKKVSRKGIPQLGKADLSMLPEMNTEDPVHRAWWDTRMQGTSHVPTSTTSSSGHDPHDPHSANPVHENPKSDSARPNTRSEWIYTAQVLWDETMADGASAWLKEKPLKEEQGRQIVIIAGAGHCHDSGIVNRVKRRGIKEVVSVRPVIETGDGELATAIAESENDYLFVMTPQ